MISARTVSLFLVLAPVLAVVGCDQTAPTNWSDWRGPNRSGVSTDTGLLKQWPEGGPPLLWTAENLGKGYSSVVIDDGVIYTMGERDDIQWLIAINADDGQELWSHKVGDDYSNDRGGGPRGTPTVVDGRVYTLGPGGDLWSVTTDGKPVWHVNLLKRFGSENLRWGLSESPLVDSDLVVVSTGGADGSIVAFDREWGELVWQSEGLAEEPSYASAIAVEVGGVRQAVHQTSEAAVGIRLSDGKPMWRYERAANSTANCATPVHDDGRVFLTSGYDTGAALLKLDSSGDESTVEEVYFTREMINHHGGVVLVDGYLYGYSNKKLVCLDFATGEKKWEARGPGKGSIAAADGMLYIFSEKGIIALAEATPEEYREVSRFQTAGQRRTWAHPVIAGGRLYLRIRDRLWCYDVSA